MTVGSNEGCMRVLGCELQVCMLIYRFCALLELFCSYEYLGRTQTEVTSLLMSCTFPPLPGSFPFFILHSQLRNVTNYVQLTIKKDDEKDDDHDDDDDDDDNSKSATLATECSVL